VLTEDSFGVLTISAFYLPPKYIVKQEQLEDFCGTQGCQFVAGEDYSSKITNKGSRLIILRGHQLLKMMESTGLNNGK
jgi:hypothetical protein